MATKPTPRADTRVDSIATLGLVASKRIENLEKALQKEITRTHALERRVHALETAARLGNHPRCRCNKLATRSGVVVHPIAGPSPEQALCDDCEAKNTFFSGGGAVAEYEYVESGKLELIRKVNGGTI